MLSGHWSPPNAFCFSCLVDLARCLLSTDADFDDKLILTVEMVFDVTLFSDIRKLDCLKPIYIHSLKLLKCNHKLSM